MGDSSSPAVAALECTRLAGLSQVPEVTARLEKWAAQLSAEATTTAAAAHGAQSDVVDGSSAAAPVAVSIKPAATQPAGPKKRPLVTLKQYAWDQSSDKVKLYITLPGVHEDGAEVELNAETESFEMVARNVGGKDHRLKLHLAGKLDPAKCASKVKPNKIVLTLRKAAADKWEHLTDKDKQAALAKKPKMSKTGDDSGDPGDSIMGMMKDMYADGDDEMRRVIGKAWTESREKTGK